MHIILSKTIKTIFGASLFVLSLGMIFGAFSLASVDVFGQASQPTSIFYYENCGAALNTCLQHTPNRTIRSNEENCVLLGETGSGVCTSNNQGVDSDSTGFYFANGCSRTGSDCIVGEFRYLDRLAVPGSSQEVYFSRIEASNTEEQVAATTLTDDGYSCVIEENQGSDAIKISSCTFEGQTTEFSESTPDPSNGNCVTFRNTDDTNEAQLSCSKNVLFFENGEFLQFWSGEGCSVFKRSNGSTTCIGPSIMETACDPVNRPRINIHSEVPEEFDRINTCEVSGSIAEFISATGDSNIAANPNDVTLDTENGGFVQNEAVGNQKTSADEPITAADLSKGPAALLLDFVAAILLIIVYIASWAALFVFWALSWVFFIFIGINPAGPDFINVALEPWRVVVSIANVAVLSSFIFVGFAYILNIEKYKQKIDQFVLNIIIITVSLSFTLFGAATFVNITHGIGNLIGGSYAGLSGASSIQEATIGGFTDSIRNVSYIRCGNIRTNNEGECNENQLGNIANFVGGGLTGNFALVGVAFGRQAGATTAALIAEIAYLAIIITAITVMWKASYMALIRAVGLWMLMVSSPLALAGYFSPIDEFKKLANQWLQKFFSLSALYPVFIFGLILVSQVSTSFTTAARTQIDNLTAGSNSGVITEAQSSILTGDDTFFSRIVVVIISAAVALAALNILISFIDNVWEKAANEILGKALAGAKTLAGVTGAAVRLGGGFVANKYLGDRSEKVKESIATLKKDRKGIMNDLAKVQNRKVQNAQQKKNQQDQLIALRKKLKANKTKEGDLNSTLARIDKRKDQVKKYSEAAGNYITFAPYAAEALVKAPGNIAKGLTKNRDAIAKAQQTKVLGNLEKYLRLNGGDELSSYLDSTEGLNSLYGLNGAAIRTLERDAIEKGLADGKRREEITSPIDDRINANVLNAFAQAAGTLGKKVDQGFAVTISDFLVKKIEAGGLQALESLGERQLFEQVVSQIPENPVLANKLLTNPDALEATRTMYSQLDPETQSKLATQFPTIIASASQRKRLGQTTSLSELKRNNVNLSIAMQDRDFVEGLLSNSANSEADLKEIYGMMNRGARDTISFESAKSSVGTSRQAYLATDPAGYKHLQAEAANIAFAEQSASQMAQDNPIFEEANNREFVQLQRDALSNGTQTNVDEIKDRMEKQLIKEFGTDDYQRILSGDIDYATLASTAMGQELQQKHFEYSNTKDPSELEAMTRHSMAILLKQRQEKMDVDARAKLDFVKRYVPSYDEAFESAAIDGLNENTYKKVKQGVITDSSGATLSVEEAMKSPAMLAIRGMKSNFDSARKKSPGGGNFGADLGFVDNSTGDGADIASDLRNSQKIEFLNKMQSLAYSYKTDAPNTSTGRTQSMIDSDFNNAVTSLMNNFNIDSSKYTFDHSFFNSAQITSGTQELQAGLATYEGDYGRVADAWVNEAKADGKSKSSKVQEKATDIGGADVVAALNKKLVTGALTSV